MKVLLLGIDALDHLILEELADDLPNFTTLRRNGTDLKVKSTFPPDSDTAWATISTGLNPAQHGVVRFVDPLEKSYQILNIGSSNEALKGKTFWDIIGQAGHDAHAIFPHLCYPVWSTPGVMVARGSSVVDVQATVPDVLDEYPNPDLLLGVRGLPDSGVAALTRHSQKLAALAQNDAEFALKLLKKLDWDVFFVYWSTLDAIGHFFWNYYDPDDPGFVEGHPLQHIIPDTYKLYDGIVGNFLEAVDDNVTVIVMSDHGHGGRPFNLVNINEVLRQAGFLSARNFKTNPHLNLFEKSKRLAIRSVSRFGLGKIAGRILRNFPGLVQTFTRPTSINWDKTIAYASDMSGIKSYSYGGVIVNKAALNGRDYETVRDEIIALLQQTCILPDRTPLLKFIARREDIYSGPFITNYPDIVLEFKYGYGLGWAVQVPLITQAAAHNVVPGSHRSDTGSFLMRSHHQVTCDTIDLHDVTPSLLSLMDISVKDSSYDGRSIFLD